MLTDSKHFHCNLDIMAETSDRSFPADEYPAANSGKSSSPEVLLEAGNDDADTERVERVYK